MGKRWLNERRQDFYYRKAKQLNYRSRASFKLHQINERFGIFRPGMAVVDLGAAPGGWLQIAKERVGPQGKVVGVDLQHIAPLEGVETIRGDMTKPETVQELMSLLRASRRGHLGHVAEHQRQLTHRSRPLGDLAIMF